MAYLAQSDSTPIHVAVVDDQPANLDLLVQLLGAQGYLVRAFPDAELAMASVKLSPPDLILLDVGLPVMDGFEACRQLRSDERTRDVPVIFLSARVDSEDIIRGFDVGGSDYVTKPIRERELLARVRVHVQVKQLQDELRKQSTLDALTGLYNRRMLDDTLRHEWNRNQRQQCWLGGIIVDVDHFKLFNDNYGHQKGDICLRSIAHAIAAAARRSGDFVARYGGDEFVVLLPNTDLVGSCIVAERIRESVLGQRLIHEYRPIAQIATVSQGVVSVVPNRDADPESVIEVADRRLYVAKRCGRNCIASEDEVLDS